MFKLEPFEKLIAMSKEAIDSAMAPIRAAQSKAKANIKTLEIDEQILAAQRAVQEMALKKEIDFDALCDKLDDIAMMEDRKRLLAEVVSQLFPEKTDTPAA